MSTHKSDFDKDMGFTLNDPVRDALRINPAGTPESAQLGYETSDVGVRGIIVFLSVLAASLAVFFVVCFALGKLINHELVKRDGPPNQWNQMYYGSNYAKKREDLVSNPVMQQQQLATLTRRFPQPRLQMDDGNQDTADLHSREDLLLEHYSYVDKNAGTIRIPIERAMELMVQRGIGSAAGNAAGDKVQTAGPAQVPTSGKPLAGERPITVTAPLTDGFARTGPEQLWDEERMEKLESREAMAEHTQAAK